MRILRSLRYTVAVLASIAVIFVLVDHFATRNQPDEAGLIPGNVYWMTILQRMVAKTKAELGDGDAAWRLNRYYAFGPGNRGRETQKTARYWLRKAADNGQRTAQMQFVWETAHAYSKEPVEAKRRIEEMSVKKWVGAQKVLDAIGVAERSGTTEIEIPNELLTLEAIVGEK